MVIYPAIDLLQQQAVRLKRGAYEEVTVYSDDPVSLAQSFEEKGATHLHVVDLEGARTGKPVHAELLHRIREKTGLFIQTGGGIRNRKTVDTLIESGVQRVILGTAAWEDPEFLEECIAAYGKKIAVGVDAKNGKVAVKGWIEQTETDALNFCGKVAAMGVGAIIYTEISRDGMLSGVDMKAYQTLVDNLKKKYPDLVLIASGGLTRPEEIGVLKESGMDGAILGKAMYEKRLSLEDAIAAAKQE